jgi:D-alanine transaminase
MIAPSTAASSLVCLNGEIMPSDQAKVSVWDRGFVFGDAVYEVCRLYRGRPWLEMEHFARLERSLGELEIRGIDLRLLRKRMHHLIGQSHAGEGLVYIQITRGVAPRAHAFPDPPVPPTEFIAIKSYDDTATQEKRTSGVKMLSHPDLRWGRCDIKSTNLLANCLALEHVKRQGGFEATLVDKDGLVTEATHSSILWVNDGRIFGTPGDDNILPGCTRLLAGQLAERLGRKIEDAKISLTDLKKADEVLLMGTSIEVMPVVTLDEATIGDGKPGPVGVELQEAYRESVREWLDRTEVIS